MFGRFERDWLLVAYVFVARHLHLRQVRPDLPNPYLVFRQLIMGAMKSGEIPKSNPDVATAMVIGSISRLIDTRILGQIRGRLSGFSDVVARASVATLRAL